MDRSLHSTPTLIHTDDNADELWSYGVEEPSPEEIWGSARTATPTPETAPLSEKNGRDNAVRLVEASFNDEELIEDEIVEISVMKTVGLDLMKDKRLPGQRE